MKYIILGLQLLPAILAAVKAAETHIVLPKAGADKLALVTGVVEEAYITVSNELKEDYSRDSVTKLMMGIISRVVAIFNRLGIFQAT
jgi:hypothetical protein